MSSANYREEMIFFYAVLMSFNYAVIRHRESQNCVHDNL